MDADGTLTVTLYTSGSIKAQTQKTLKKGDPDHERYVKHIAGIEPGE
jgi:RNase P/RNase MRP subunit POP5